MFYGGANAGPQNKSLPGKGAVQKSDNFGGVSQGEKIGTAKTKTRAKAEKKMGGGKRTGRKEHTGKDGGKGGKDLEAWGEKQRGGPPTNPFWWGGGKKKRGEGRGGGNCDKKNEVGFAKPI